MTKHIAPLPDPDGSLLLRELNHRVNNELTSTIGTIFSQSGAHDEGWPRLGRHNNNRVSGSAKCDRPIDVKVAALGTLDHASLIA
jgi:hypothetical protein